MHLRTVKGYLVLTLCASYVVNFFMQSEAVRWFSAILTFVVFALGLFHARKFTGILSLIMFASAVYIVWHRGEGLYVLSEIIIANLPLLTLIIAVPLLSIPLKEEGYFAAAQALIRRWNTNHKRIFAGISGFISIFGPVLNIGTLRIVHEMVKDLKLNERLLARAYFTGFSTIVTWSPFFASVAFVLYLLDVPVADYVSVGLPFAFVEIVLGYVLILFVSRKMRRPQLGHPEAAVPALTSGDRKNIVYLLLMLFAIIFSIFFIERITQYPIMILVVMVSVIFPILWSAVRNKWPRLHAQFNAYRSEAVTAMDNEIITFVSAGMFGAALSGTTFSAGIQEMIVALSSDSFVLFSAGIIVIMAFFGFIGIHPIVIVTVLSSLMSPELIGARPEALALLFMIGWSIVAVISPVTPLNLLVSSYLNRNSYEVGLRYNASYLLCLLAAGALYVSLVR